MDLQFLPHIVVTNPHIRKVYDSYQHAFDTLHNLSPVKTVEQNAEFTVLLKRLVDEHGQSSLLLAYGGLCRQHLTMRMPLRWISVLHSGLEHW